MVDEITSNPNRAIPVVTEDGLPTRQMIEWFDDLELKINELANTAGNFSGPAGAVTDNLVSFRDASGDLGKDSGIGSADVVQGPASAVNENIVLFDNTTGKLIKDSGKKVSDFGDVNGPGSSINNRLVLFDATTGKLIKQSSILESNVVTPSSSNTFTNKNYDANDTGNNLLNIDIANCIAASQAEAEAGVENTKLLTSLRVAQAITAQAGAGATDANNLVSGLTCSNGTDSDHDIDIAVGLARDFGDAVTMILASSITKRIDASWVVGTNQGGLDTGTVASSTGYGIYLIRRSDTGVVDAIFSLDSSPAGSSVTLPANYDQLRLIGAVITDGSANIRQFIHIGDYFALDDSFVDFNATVNNATVTNVTLKVPADSIADFVIEANPGATPTLVALTAFNFNGSSGGRNGVTTELQIVSGGTIGFISESGSLKVDSSSRIKVEQVSLPAANAVVEVIVYGFTMLRRSNPK